MLSMGQATPNYPFQLVIWGPRESAPKQHLDRFVFVWLTNVTNRQTDTQTDHVTPSVAIGRI